MYILVHTAVLDTDTVELSGKKLAHGGLGHWSQILSKRLVDRLDRGHRVSAQISVMDVDKLPGRRRFPSLGNLYTRLSPQCQEMDTTGIGAIAHARVLREVPNALSARACYCLLPAAVCRFEGKIY